MKKVLITGIGGMDGSHMAEKLLDVGDFEVFGTERKMSFDWPPNIAHLKGKIKLVTVDLLDEDGMNQVIAEVSPGVIFHFAAKTYVPAASASPWETIDNNVRGQLNLHQAVEKARINPLILVACTAAEYGNVPKAGLPIDEETLLAPTNIYGVSKVGQDMLAAYYFTSGQKVIRVRPFNHAGPRRGGEFVESAFARQIVEIEKGEQEPVIKVGNLSPRRDWLHVADVIDAYVALMERGKVGEVYNIGSGVSHSVQELLDTMLSFSSVVDKVKIETDPSRVRKIDEEEIRADISKIKKDTGWAPKLTFEKMCEDTLAWWRDQKN